MENNIVQDFQNLRVFSNHNVNRMDELVHDLSTALEESAKSCPRGPCATQENNNALSSTAGAVPRRYHKRRRGARRAATNSVYGKRGTISEASESSVDETCCRDHQDMDNSVVTTTHSDSDDLSLTHPKHRLKVPMAVVAEPVPPVESDSFTENLSPMRPQRRRRRFKHMAVDSLQPISQSGSGGEGCSKRRSSTPTMLAPTTTTTPSGGGGASSAENSKRMIHYYHHHHHSHHHPSHHHHHHHYQAGASHSHSHSHSPGSLQSVVPGKRKRGSKGQREGKGQGQAAALGVTGAGAGDSNKLDAVDSMDLTNGNLSQESSSLSSSEVDSDVYNHADEGREADDEQSDFFHEPEDVSVPLIPWWEDDGVMEGGPPGHPHLASSPGHEEFNHIISGALSLMSQSSQKSFRKRMDKCMARTEVLGGGREIRIGRRKLKGNIPRYTMLRFLQDQEQWSTMQGGPPGGGGPHLSPGASWNNGYSSQSGDYKRLRQTPPPPLDPNDEDSGGTEAVPVTVASRSPHLSANNSAAGWFPLTPPGPDGDQTTNHQHQEFPVIAYRRRSCKGLGYETQSDT